MNIPIDPEGGYARAQGADVGWFWLTLCGLFVWVLAIACKVLACFVRERQRRNQPSPGARRRHFDNWGCE